MLGSSAHSKRPASKSQHAVEYAGECLRAYAWHRGHYSVRGPGAALYARGGETHIEKREKVRGCRHYSARVSCQALPLTFYFSRRCSRLACGCSDGLVDLIGGGRVYFLGDLLNFVGRSGEGFGGAAEGAQLGRNRGDLVGRGQEGQRSLATGQLALDAAQVLVRHTEALLGERAEYPAADRAAHDAADDCDRGKDGGKHAQQQADLGA